MSAAQLRHLLHHFAIEHFAVGVFVALDAVAAPGAPLLEEKGCTVSLYLLLDIDHPLQPHRASLGSTLTTYDNPVNAAKVHFSFKVGVVQSLP